MGVHGYLGAPLDHLFQRFDYNLIEIEHVVRTTQWLNENREEIHKNLTKSDKNLAHDFYMQWENDPALLGLRTFDFRGMALCRAVDSFQRILSAFVGEVFKHHPETVLASDGEVSVAEVLECQTIDNFKVWLAVRTLRRLGHFSQVRKFVARIGVNVRLDRKTDDLVTQAIATRNSQVHGGSAHGKSIRTSGRRRVRVGQPVRIDDSNLWEMIDALRRAADAFQVALGGKYFGRGKSLLPSQHAAFARRGVGSRKPGKAD